MTVDQRRRSELFEGLAAVIGRKAASTMFALLPPDADRLEQRVDQRFEQIDQRFERLEQRLDERTEVLRNELLAAFRAELVTAASGQTRAVIVATATATFGIGGLAPTLAQLL